jgi:hypothetical protein
MEFILTRQSTLLSVQRALLGVVTTSLRTVDVFWTEKTITVWFTYDAGSSNLDQASELRSEFETQLLADFFPHVEITVHAEETDGNSKIECRGVYAFFRA